MHMGAWIQNETLLALKVLSGLKLCFSTFLKSVKVTLKTTFIQNIVLQKLCFYIPYI